MMDKLKIEYVDIDTIKPYSNNAKMHPQEQIEQIKKSIQEFGNNDPIAVWNNEIVEGHGRYEALKQLGGGLVPIIRLDNLSDEERKAYALVHNKLTMNSDFDFNMLDAELAELDIDMSEFGFNIETFDIEDNEYEEQDLKEFLKAQETGEVVELCCAIGDDTIDGKPYSEIVDIAREYIHEIGGFEKFAEWGLY